MSHTTYCGGDPGHGSPGVHGLVAVQTEYAGPKPTGGARDVPLTNSSDRRLVEARVLLLFRSQCFRRCRPAESPAVAQRGFRARVGGLLKYLISHSCYIVETGFCCCATHIRRAVATPIQSIAQPPRPE